jgi:hypothetical protein
MSAADMSANGRRPAASWPRAEVMAASAVQFLLAQIWQNDARSVPRMVPTPST